MENLAGEGKLELTNLVDDSEEQKALMKGLAQKGHKVDVISTFPQKHPTENYTDIIVLPAPTMALHNSLTYKDVKKISAHFTHWASTDIGNKPCTNLGHPEMLEFIKNPPKDPPYDLVIIEFVVANCFAALGQHLKVPVIGAISSALYPWNNRLIANPSNLAFVPSNTLGYTATMNFWQRIYNTLSAFYSDLCFQYVTGVQDELLKKYFGDDVPGVRQLEKNLALIFINTHYSVNGPKPMTSTMIEVGGLHIQNDGPKLSKDLAEWMDNSTEGFVYFTFGSMIAIESLPDNTLRSLYKSFEKMAPIRVLMKIQNLEELPFGLPANIRTFKWVSQLRVLKHKNIKAFITHGGLMSSQEAIHCGVPMIGMPIFADQFTNVELWTTKKIAIKMPIEEITEETMDRALNEIIYNSLYKNAIREASEQFHDRPMKPLDTAIWWVEYVIRNGGNVLRSPALDLYWWQIELLDVYLFLLSILALLTFITIRSVQFIISINSVQLEKSVRAIKPNQVD